MHIQVFTSCTGKKRVSPKNQLSQEDFADRSELKHRKKELRKYRLPAAKMYTGEQHVRLMKGVRAARKMDKGLVTVKIVSAGYGLLDETTKIVPYNITFSTMKAKELDLWSRALGLRKDFQVAANGKVAEEPVDLNLVLLGTEYLKALRISPTFYFKKFTIFIVGKSGYKLVKNFKGKVAVHVTEREDCRRLSAGNIALKGEIARRVIKQLMTKKWAKKIDLLSDRCLDNLLP